MTLTDIGFWNVTRTAARLLAGLALTCGLASQAGEAPVEVCSPAHAVTIAPGVTRTVAAYPMPAVSMQRADGQRVQLADVLNDGRPVLLNFIYTSCNTVCPVTSQVFQQTRELLGNQREQVNMVSISIDPEQDTPRKLAAYARRYATAGSWTHLTGTAADAVAVQRAFAAWRGDKMNHQPVTFLRISPGQPWIRLDGFASPEQLVAEYRRAAGSAS
ncbi:SCO family protein [Leptothrix sp. BB-4]